ncbi:Uncharacterized protein APZ42_009500, partial [Daphnia magna]
FFYKLGEIRAGPYSKVGISGARNRLGSIVLCLTKRQAIPFPRYRRLRLFLKKSQFWFFLDNSTAVAYINHGGGTRSPALTEISSQLTTWCEDRSISLEAVHLAGKLNSIADAESRAGPDSGD